MKKKISLLLLALVFLFAFEVASAEEYLVVDRDEQSSGVEITQAGEKESWDIFYDAEKGKYQVVYNITNEAPDEVTLDLTLVNDVLLQYVNGTLENDPDVKQALEENRSSVVIERNNIYFGIYLKTMEAIDIIFEPGDKLVYNVIIKNSSGKTYTYKEGSLTITTSKKPEYENDVKGFDGQTINPKYSNDHILKIGFNNKPEDHNIVNILADRVIDIYNTKYNCNKTRKDLRFRDIQSIYEDYLKDNYSSSLENALLSIFNEKYNKKYDTIKELMESADKISFLKEISCTVYNQFGTFEYGKSLKYDNFYNSLFSIVIDDEESYNEYNEKNGIEWSMQDGSATVGKYMSEEVNQDNNGRYKYTDDKLSDILENVKPEELREFTFGYNLDGNTNNSYQLYQFGYYASIKMVAKKGILIINYVDDNGNTLKESERIEYYYYEVYETKAADIKDYELIKVEGIEKGTIEADETIVTYIYQYVMGEGGEEFDVVQTGSDIDYSLMSSAAITLSLIGLAIYSKRKHNN